MNVQVAPHLWVGTPPTLGINLSDRFDRLVLAAREHQYPATMFPGILVVHVPLNDTLPTPDEEHAAIQAGRVVGAWMKREKSVLITCGRALNRSCLVAAVGLMTTGYCWTEAVEKVRAARGPFALRNPYFQRLLRRLEDATAFQLASGV
jgi:protein-tyrosine phosphatase